MNREGQLMQILLHQINKDLLMINKDLLMKEFLVNGVSFSKYTILSESMAVVNIVSKKAKISEQALANHTPPLDTNSRENITTAANQTATSRQRMQKTWTHGMAADDVSHLDRSERRRKIYSQTFSY